jgi:hypothetical protein
MFVTMNVCHSVCRMVITFGKVYRPSGIYKTKCVRFETQVTCRSISGGSPNKVASPLLRGQRMMEFNIQSSSSVLGWKKRTSQKGGCVFSF